MVSLTSEQIAHFRDEGYVVVEGLLDPERDLAPVIEEYAGVLDRFAGKLFAAGRVATHQGPDRIDQKRKSAGHQRKRYWTG